MTISLETWAIGGAPWGVQGARGSLAAIHAAVDDGLNRVDAAHVERSRSRRAATVEPVASAAAASVFQELATL